MRLKEEEKRMSRDGKKEKFMTVIKSKAVSVVILYIYIVVHVLLQ